MAAQIVKHLAGMRTLRDGTQHTVLRLAPEHLGNLTLTVDVRAGSVHLAVAGNEAALATLRDGLGSLRDQLSQSGLDLGDVTLRQDTGGPGRGGARDQPAPQQAPQQTDAQPGYGGRPRDGAPGGSAPGSGAAPGSDRADVTLIPSARVGAGASTATGSGGSIDVRM